MNLHTKLNNFNKNVLLSIFSLNTAISIAAPSLWIANTGNKPFFLSYLAGDGGWLLTTTDPLEKERVLSWAGDDVCNSTLKSAGGTVTVNPQSLFKLVNGDSLSDVFWGYNYCRYMITDGDWQHWTGFKYTYGADDVFLNSLYLEEQDSRFKFNSGGTDLDVQVIE